MSLKRPFGKVRKIQRKQDGSQQKIEQKQQKIQIKEQKIQNQQKQKEIISKTPVFTLGSKKNKINIQNKNVYDVLKKNQNIENNQIQPKAPMKLDLLKKKNGIKLVNPDKPPLPPTIVDQLIQAPRPTPLFRGKKTNLELKNRSRERIILDDDNQAQDAEQSTSMQMRPDMKIKHKIKTGRQSFQREQQKPPLKIQQKQQTQNVIYVPIEPTQINIQTHQKISQSRKQKQQLRTKQLRNLLNLQIDLYQQLLSIDRVQEYQVYINKIKNNIIKNSIDQSFDQKNSQATQTIVFDFNDFNNQCPQDYQTKINIQTDADQILNKFILKVAPVIQELIHPSNEITMPPIYLLAFRPKFKKFLLCPYPIFIYESQSNNLGIIVIGQKLYITKNNINTVLSIGNNLIGGLDDGKLVLWNGQNNKNNKLYHQIYQIITSTNFQLPSYINNDLQRLSLYNSYGKIVSLVSINYQEFYSLDQNAKLIHWKIQNNTLKGIKIIDFSITLQRDSLIAYKLKQRGSNLFILTSRGLLIYNSQQILKKLQISNTEVIDFQLPKRSTLIYLICQDNTVKIYDEKYLKQLYVIPIDSASQLQSIILPQLQYENISISNLSHFYVSNQKGKAYQIDLLSNTVQHKSVIQSSHQNRDIIYQVINRYHNNKLQIITLWNDLKSVRQVYSMSINMEKSISNFKTIIEHNKTFQKILEINNIVFQ